MNKALELAQQAADSGEVPVGALVVFTDPQTQQRRLLGSGYNCPIAHHDPSAHAEITALRVAGRNRQNYRLPDCEIYVTLEPCAMCAGAIIQARLSRVVFGAADERSGAGGSVFNILNSPSLNHRCEVTAGVCADESRRLLQAFFAQRRSSSSSA